MRTQKIRNRLLSTTIIGGFAALAFAAPAMAQDAEPTEIGEVVVTGSRIPQTNLVTTSPVTQVTGEDIDTAGVTRVEDLITELPQAFAAQNSAISNGASGTATVSLRNLGSARTLVLIDGRRMPYGSPNSIAADLNQIPGQLVERVEVLTGGASAVYGSDAIAGVVNFIMRRDFEGLQIDAQYGFYQHNNDYDGVGNIRAEILRRGATNPSQFQLPADNVNDGFSREVTATLGVGTGDGRGNITAYASYRNNDEVLQRERDYSACAIGAPNSATGPDTFSCFGSSAAFPGRFSDFGLNRDMVDPDGAGPLPAVDLNPLPSFDSTLNGSGGFRGFTGNDLYNYGPLNFYQRPDERYSLGSFARYELNPHVEVYADLMFTDYSSYSQIAPTAAFFNTGTINCDNPFLSAAQRSTIGCGAPAAAAFAAGYIADPNRVPMYVGRRNVEGGGRQDDLRYQSYRMVGGVRGPINDWWSYDLTAQYSRVQLSRVYRNEFLVSRLTRALDAVDVGGVPTCRSVVDGTDPNCVPYDIFTGAGPSAAALAYLSAPLLLNGSTTQQVLTGAMTGDLGGHGVRSPWAEQGVQVAFGLEYRRDELDSTPDTNFQSGDGAGQGGATTPLSGVNDVLDMFVEAQFPLIEGRPFFDRLSIDAAYRYSDYALGGQTDTYKIGADWAPVPDIRFRGSFQRAVRAPNVIELFTSQGFGLFDMDADPCGPAMTATLAQCQATGVPTGQYGSGALNSPAGQYNFLGGGNPSLAPEESETLTFGAVFRPDFLPGFNLTVDWFNIKIDKLISSVGAVNIIDGCYTNNVAALCSLINRNPAGQLWIGDGHVVDLSTNIGGLETTGVDVVANYGVDLADWGMGGVGSLAFSYVGTVLDELVTDTGLGFANSVYDCAGFFGTDACGQPNPKYRHRARVTWQTPWDVDLSGTWRHYGEVEIGILGADGSLNNGGTRIDRYFKAENYLDLVAVWQVRDDVRLRAGVNNVLDNDPPLSRSVGAGSGNGNTYPALYDALGRYFFFGVTADF